MPSTTSSNGALPLGLGASERAANDVSPPQARSYGQILKSSALIGGSTVVSIALSIVRTKAMALILGPGGVGLLGIYGSIADLARTVAGMGLGTSGVRQIAEAVGSGDNRQIARTVTTLRRVALLLGVAGALLLVLFCQPIARLSFGDAGHTGAVALLALVVLLGAVSGGQTALIQGMRRIGDLARLAVVGSLYGTVLSIVVIYFYGERGLVPSLVCVSAMGILTSWWYSRKIKVEHVEMTFRDVSGEVSALLKLGFVFMASSFMSMVAAYVVRIIVLRKIGEHEAGYYQAAWALGGMYVGFILQAMAADFYPRLTAVANDNGACNQLVNEQAEVGLLLAGPGVLGTLTFAPLVILVFYSAKFGPAVEVLRWLSLGMFMRVASWPMGFILGAKGLRQAIFWSELAAYAIQIALAWVCICVLRLGLDGAGIAFFFSYVLYWGLIYVIVRRVSGFRWSAANKQIGLLHGLLISAVFLGWYWLPRSVVVAAGTVITLWVGFVSLKKLLALVAFARLPRLAQRLVVLLRLGPSNVPA
jgi:enterobacterial common antigen flippase